MGMLAAVLGLCATGCAGGGDVAGPQSRVCPPSDCESGATYTGRIKLAAADRARAEITVCRNDVCATAYPAQQASSSLTYAAALLGPLGGRVQLTGSPDLADANMAYLKAATSPVPIAAPTSARTSASVEPKDRSWNAVAKAQAQA